MDETNLPLVEEADNESRLFLTDIAIERIDASSEYRNSLDLTECWIFPSPDAVEGVRLVLSKISSQRWAMDGDIELSSGIDSIRCLLKDNAGDEVGSVRLMWRGEQGGENAPGSGISQQVETDDERLKLVVTWTVVEASSENIEELDKEAMEAFLDELNDYGTTFSIQFESTGDPSDIEEAISALQKAVRFSPAGHPQLPGRLSNLGNAYLSRFEYTGALSDADEAIAALQKSVAITPEDDYELPARLSNLGNCFTRRFEHTATEADIKEAISSHRRAVHLTPEDHADYLVWTNNLGSSLKCLFEHTGDLESIGEAISLTRRAARGTPVDDPDLPCMLSNLGNLLWYRFERIGDLADITEAITSLERAVELTPDGHADAPSRLSNLGNSYWSRFKHLGNLDDIAAGISAQQKAVYLTDEGRSGYASLLDNLGNMFFSRFQRTRDRTDLTEAIGARRRATELTPPDHTDFPLRLSNLGSSLLSQSEVSNDISDAAEAITLLEKAVSLTYEHHLYLSSSLNALGDSYLRRFELGKDIQDITQAIDTLERSANLIPSNSAELPSVLNNLGVALESRFNATHDLEDLSKAISAQERAIQFAPEGHAGLPLWRTNLASSLYTRWGISHSRGDLDACISHFKTAATYTFGAPRTKLKAAVRWAQLQHAHYPETDDVVPAFDTSMALLAMTAGLEQTVERRFAHLEELSGLASGAASVAFSLGRLDKALEWLEQGRCLVWNQLNTLRTPLDDLRIYDEALAGRVEEVSKALVTAGTAMGLRRTAMDLSEKITVEQQVREHWDSARQWEELLAEVRSIQGFKDFLRPPTCSSLHEHLPKDGYIVVINVHRDRCDAVAMFAGSHQPLHIPLPDFSLKKATDYHTKLHSRLQAQGLRMREDTQDVESDRALGKYRSKAASGENVITSVLRGLWNDMVKPILAALGLSKPPATSRASTRIWWCPTGQLSFLPIHAAGIYTGSTSECLLDYAISSYTPSVTALTDRVKLDRPVDPSVSGLFLTSQPNAPGSARIPGTTKEVQAVYESAVAKGVRVIKLEGDDVSVDECLAYMGQYSSIHLACHASQNAAEPLQSRFRFHKGTLALSTIIEKNLQNADLAFLSACQTSTGEVKLSDEAVHLAAGMLAAGYRRVVATMWAIRDKHASDVAREFYQYLWICREEGEEARFDGSLSAYALHHSIRLLRERLDSSEDSLLAWIPYVHFGY